MKKSQIENARRQMTEQPNAATNCSAWRVKPQEVADMLKRYGSGESFLNTFNPDLQVMTARYTERAYFGTAPSLATVAEGYGEQLAIVWNCIQLENINLFAGVKEKLNVERQKELSRLILAEYPQLKVTELLLFFHRLKCGRYGRFYGTVDALFIASALLSFMDERRAETSLYKAAAKKKEIAPEKKSGNSITYQEYLLLKSEKQQNKKI